MRKALWLFLAAVAFAQVRIPGPGGAVAASSAYTYNKTITVSSTAVSGSSDLTNFTIPIIFTDASLKSTGNGGVVMDAQGDDIVLGAATNCASVRSTGWILHSWDPTTGAVVFHVLQSTFSHTTNTTISICAGNAAITTFQGGTASAQWDSGYKGVWPFSDGTTLSLADYIGASTLTNNNMATAMAGQYDGAVNLVAASTQYLSSASNGTNNFTAPLTISAWIYIAGGTYNSILDKGSGGWAYFFATRMPNLTWFSGGGSENVSSPSLSTNTWTHVAVSLATSAGTLKFYINGTLDTTTTATGANSTNAVALNIGAYNGGSQPFNGKIQQVELSNVVRSDDWIKTDDNLQRLPGTYISVS